MVRRKFWKEIGPFGFIPGMCIYKDVLVSNFYRNRNTRRRVKVYRRRQDKRNRPV